MRIAYVIGTFSAHPVVMGAMNEFLRWAGLPSTAQEYEAMDQRCAAWTLATNRALAGAGLPLRVVRLGTVWTMLFTEPGRYNWLLQYYLRAEGVTLSWVGTGRCLSSMDFTDEDYEALRVKLLDAARRMKADGWWLSAQEHPGRERSMRKGLVTRAARESGPDSPTDSARSTRRSCGARRTTITPRTATSSTSSSTSSARARFSCATGSCSGTSRRRCGPGSPRCSSGRSAMPCSSRRVTTRRRCCSATTRATRR